MNSLEYAEQQLNRFYLDRNEFIKKNPSYPFIQSYSEVLLQLIIELEQKDKIVDTKLISLRMEANIFKEDLPGELYDDYKKGNLRYRENWFNQKKKIDNITTELYQYLSEISDK
ncbi:hypothetical protein SAMN05421846_101500 [Chryseobacterium taeanense]|uniref:HEPN domain-containing protein n=1 Tax=Chryseobacterium taeanense TaxID=311334 RepID=A0A1G8EBA7_9FLAO|nr:hypothetical protein [Chryseobacterium taeanense]SDH67127.1 hypothetical protein SAMN05421846_101500 [Chryseobacterium taeanense]